MFLFSIIVCLFYNKLVVKSLTGVILVSELSVFSIQAFFPHLILSDDPRIYGNVFYAYTWYVIY